MDAMSHAPTRINIKTGWSLLVRVTYDDAGELTLESNLSEQAAARAIGQAMEGFGKAVGADVAEQARLEVAELRAKNPPLQAFAFAIARMVSEITANLKVPDVDLDVGEWSRGDSPN